MLHKVECVFQPDELFLSLEGGGKQEDWVWGDKWETGGITGEGRVVGYLNGGEVYVYLKE